MNRVNTNRYSFIPLFNLFKYKNNEISLVRLLQKIGLPTGGILLFLFFWSVAAQNIDTSLGKFPGPTEVFNQANSLVAEHQAERLRETEFYQRQQQRNADKLAKDPYADIKTRPYTGSPTYFDQILTSMITVLSGFILASAIAIPLGVIIGLSKTINAALAPVIQIFKPVSPLAWLPLVTMVVSAVYVTDDPLFAKSFLNSMFTVTLCSLWPTLINTSVGVANVNSDLINVSKVLRLSWLTHTRKIVLPSSIPMIFTGLRLSLSIAWMVLIAAEMLAQNPGLGKFVWDEFQNGSSNSLGRIMVAVLTIGFIGFLLDRIMLMIQQRVNWDRHADIR
ncbi:ABC transporter permease [Gynuella sunshinyii]|uniref:ABC-type nitrate/sulfonate/bicarbonate transport system, permease component n=1 Tax=Gynuella sunshinyii YC6258 TaxID=1445510 RepID=A0A0C5VSG9_9GAMM|nr:ABC transporter permease [Gynuella sunshinyii]AJQ96243.1 ABC-type nitrate/sulfonate/bicarbonate transport system, permease component [Gynuella sunshinyii YC6258]